MCPSAAARTAASGSAAARSAGSAAVAMAATRAPISAMPAARRRTATAVRRRNPDVRKVFMAWDVQTARQADSRRCARTKQRRLPSCGNHLPPGRDRVHSFRRFCPPPASSRALPGPWHASCFVRPRFSLRRKSVMPLNLDAYLGVHRDALKLYGQRTAVLANNIANADTPNYKAQDIDFCAVLAGTAAGSGARALPLSTTNGAHAAGAAAGPGTAQQLKYRVPLAPSLDGNTVDVQMEQAAFADNSVRYQAALSFLSGKFRDLMTAITGQ